mmetsp:Transcript_57469/g.102817  ORF Transcript_57469/g.102817 Transcript_57469/m.102817 type:complete len:227 (-) Transcript_57469:449-1129(-)
MLVFTKHFTDFPPLFFRLIVDYPGFLNADVLVGLSAVETLRDGHVNTVHNRMHRCRSPAPQNNGMLKFICSFCSLCLLSLDTAGIILLLATRLLVLPALLLALVVLSRFFFAASNTLISRSFPLDLVSVLPLLSLHFCKRYASFGSFQGGLAEQGLQFQAFLRQGLLQRCCHLCLIYVVELVTVPHEILRLHTLVAFDMQHTNDIDGLLCACLRGSCHLFMFAIGQ